MMRLYIVVLAVCPEAALSAHARPGDLDSEFGTGGVVITSLGDQDRFNVILASPDGKLVAAGSTGGIGFALGRYNADGRLDATFGSGGTVTTSLDAGIGEIFGLVGQPAGKIVAGGSACKGGGSCDFALVRYATDGRVDPTFGTEGVITTPVGPTTDIVLALALQLDGKIVAAGAASDGSSTKESVINKGSK